MAREIRLHRDAEKFLRKVDKKTFNRIAEALENQANIPPVGDIKRCKVHRRLFVLELAVIGLFIG